MVYMDSVKVTVKSQDFSNITGKLEEIIRLSKVKDGLCNLFSVGSTSAIIINEDEPMLLEDMRKKLDKIASEKEIYQHVENAHSHIRSMLLGNSQTVPIRKGKLMLGTWQEIFVANFDTKERDREVLVTVLD